MLVLNSIIYSSPSESKYVTRILFTGEGQFGKVYTAVNNDTGVLMAMKEVIFLLDTL